MNPQDTPHPQLTLKDLCTFTALVTMESSKVLSATTDTTTHSDYDISDMIFKALTGFADKLSKLLP